MLGSPTKSRPQTSSSSCGLDTTAPSWRNSASSNANSRCVNDISRSPETVEAIVREVDVEPFGAQSPEQGVRERVFVLHHENPHDVIVAVGSRRDGRFAENALSRSQVLISRFHARFAAITHPNQ